MITGCFSREYCPLKSIFVEHNATLDQSVLFGTHPLLTTPEILRQGSKGEARLPVIVL